MQKWREKYSPGATCRNLAKSFYDAGKPGLVETVCEVVTHGGSTKILQLCYSPSPRLWLFGSCKYCVVIIIVAVAGLLSASYISQSDHPNCDNFSSKPNDDNAFQTKLGKPLYKQNAENISPNDLPHLPGPFVGRDEDVNNIISILFSANSFVRMVNIFGLPAVGKSTLAIHTGYEMASREVVVRYINVDETHIFKSHYGSESTKTEQHDQNSLASLQFITDITQSRYSHTETKFASIAHDLVEWAKRLSNVTLLILDNCDSLLQGRKGGNTDFLRVLGALSKASPYLHTLTTSRLKVKLLDAKPYKLKQLDSESAIKLLKFISPHITLSERRTINGLLDGIPLALKIVGSLVSEEKPSNIVISQLHQNLIETLTPEDIALDTEKMRPVLRVSYSYLDNDTQECALYLSHFPGSFSEEAALDILSNCTNSSPSGCLRKLSYMSLLDTYYYAGQPRYKFHRIIKEYLFDVESKRMPIIVTSVNWLFNSSFLLHYTQTLNYFVTTYNQVPQDEENIGRFEHDSHNFECLLEKVYTFELWTVTSVVDLSRALTCNLMLKTFTTEKLLSTGQKTLLKFERRMDEISTQIGALETLNTYRDLVLVLRNWIQLFPESDCKFSCEETFLQQGFETRLQIIYRQLVKTDVHARDFHRELLFPFYSGSICLSYCLHFASFDHHMVILCSLTLLMLMVARAITRGLAIPKLLDLLAVEFLLCIGLYLDTSPVIPAYIAMLVGIRSGGFSLINLTVKRDSHRRYLAILYYFVFWVLLICAFNPLGPKITYKIYSTWDNC